MSGNSELSSISLDSTVASGLSQNAAVMWQHYATVQVCERNLATGQQSVLQNTSGTKTNSLPHKDLELEDNSSAKAVVSLEQKDYEGEKGEDKVMVGEGREGEEEGEVMVGEGREGEEEGMVGEGTEGEEVMAGEGREGGKGEDEVVVREGTEEIKEEDEMAMGEGREGEMEDEVMMGEGREQEKEEGEVMVGDGREGEEEEDNMMAVKGTQGGKEEEVVMGEERERGSEGGTEVMEGVTAASQDIGRAPLQDTIVKDVSLALASVLLLPETPPTRDSPTSSLSSSCFVTPASTPSRSPSPHPHFSHSHSITPSLISQQVANLGSDFIDGQNDLESTPNDTHQHGNHGNELSDLPPKSMDMQTDIHIAIVTDSSSQTDVPLVREAWTNTEKMPELVDTGVQTDDERGRRRDAASNTDLHIDPELMERAKLAEQLAQIRSELTAGMVERNETRSQQMVAEEMARIVQSELVDMRQRNVAETTDRIRLENKLGELQVELSSTRKELEEKCQRVLELEDILKGTSLLVRKLEEQSAASLMNRGGIDHMLQAKLADARAQEAEQQLEVVQVELLQSQGEVKRLLDRVVETTRNRSEMVSSKVHNQLLQIADERANTAEQKALQLERELLSLREQSEDAGHVFSERATTSSLSLSTYTRPSSYTSTLGGYPSLSSTLPPFTTSYKSPYSLSSHSPLPPSTSVSLEPFKLSFSLPSSSSSTAVSVPDSDKAALPSSTGLSSYPTTTTDEHTGLLKPSVVLGRGVTASDKHVTWNSSGAAMTSSPSSPGQRDVTGSTNGMATLELPSFEPTTPPDQGLPPPSDTTTCTGDKDSSSDWSSSDEDDDDVINPLCPSTHSTLQAQWEWRAMTEADSDKYGSLLATSHTSKKKPPPVAPKPRISWTHSTLTTDYISQEDPSSFLEPARGSGLNPLSSSFRRPRGPQGRNLPSRFSNYSQFI